MFERSKYFRPGTLEKACRAMEVNFPRWILISSRPGPEPVMKKKFFSIPILPLLSLLKEEKDFWGKFRHYPVKNVTWIFMKIPCHFMSQMDDSLVKIHTKFLRLFHVIYPGMICFPCSNMTWILDKFKSWNFEDIC